jgi:hypothetical protein
MTHDENTWYAIFPDGGAWFAVKVDSRWRIVDTIEESNAATHMTAGDQYSRIVSAILNSETDPNVSTSHAEIILAEAAGGNDTECYAVERVIL